MKTSHEIKLSFLGGAGQVTGSKSLIEYRGKKILIDCGLFQGPKEVRSKNYEGTLSADSIDFVILTHAHIDHTGYLPKLVKDGYKNPIYCSGGTKELSRIMLMDTAYLQLEDHSQGGEKPLYGPGDAEATVRLFKSVEMDHWKELMPGLSFRLLRAGHILGSAYVQILFDIENGTRLLTFSGDVGNGRSLVIRPPVPVVETDYLVLESTYGDRVQPRVDPLIELEKVINKVISRGGTLIIPSFAVGRAQELLFLIHLLEENKKIPKVKVYLDSPMALDATEIYMHHADELLLSQEKEQLKLSVTTQSFTPVQTAKESKEISLNDDPKIIISAAGMLTGGRVLHHLYNKLPDSKSAVLFVGYQAEGTKGRLLKNGMTQIRIHNTQIPVHAEIISLESLSAHADSDDLMDWLKNLKRVPKMVFLNHGDISALRAMEYRVVKELGWPCEIAKEDQIYSLGKGIAYERHKNY